MALTGDDIERIAHRVAEVWKREPNFVHVWRGLVLGFLMLLFLKALLS